MANQGIITKLDRFIKKYYKNLLIRGVLYSIIALLSFFIFLSIIEYFGYFSSLIRSIIFYGFIIISLVQIYFQILLPFFKYNKLGKRISYAQASKIIGDFFPEVSDKLLNLLQLQSNSNTDDSELLEASINQRTRELSFVPFVKAIDYSKNKKYIKWAIIPIITIIIIFSIYPQLISEPTYRYLNYSKHFSPPSPFNFILLNTDLNVLEKDDYEVKVRVDGKSFQNEVDIIINGNLFHMKKQKKDNFSFNIKHVQDQMSFYFLSSGVKSKEYKLNLRPKPIIIDLQAKVIYPDYTGIKEEVFTNITDFSIPKGSKILWFGLTRDTKKVIFEFPDSKIEIIPEKRGNISLIMQVMKNISYRIFTINEYSLYSDSMEFKIDIISDLSPQIAVIEQKDSLMPEKLYFRGQIKDDYGFSKLKYFIEKEDKNSNKSIEEVNILINKSENTQEFYFYYDLTSLDLDPKDKVSYYFEVWDNDKIDGNKSSKSQVFTIEIPSLEEIKRESEKISNVISKETEESLSQIKKLQEEIKELQKKILEKKSMDWQDKKQLEELLKKQEEIKRKLENIKNKIQENNILDDKYKNHSDKILEKKKEIDKLFEKLLSEEMKDMLVNLDKMIKEKLDKDKLNESLDKLNSNNQDLEKELDRNLELFKRLEVEKKIEETIENLNQISKEEKELSMKTNQGLMPQDKLKEKQEEISKKFEDIKKDIKKLNESGSKLEEPLSIEINIEKEKSIEDDLKKAMDNLEKKMNNEASKSQKSASEKMDEMANSIQEDMDDIEEEELGEDINEIRQILKNLVILSINQEDLMDKVSKYSVNDPKYQDLIYNQNKIKNDMEMISDSLFSISKRQPQVSSAINKEITIIRNQISSSIENLLKYNQGIYNNYKNLEARTPQQYTMTSMNNLALMLAESLKNMENLMQSKKNSKSSSKGKPKSSCSNPKKGKTKKDIREMQEGLNKEMERLRKELDNQKKSNQGKLKIGEGRKLNEELAKMASQQEMIRRILSELAAQEKASQGKSNPDLDNLIRQMEQTERDIVNKAINQQTINRQNNILTRLLEHEKASLQREKEEKRESNEGMDRFNNSNELLEFEKLKNRELELFKQVPPSFSPYYKNKVDEYFINLNLK